MDSQYANKEFAKQIGVDYPLLSDFQRTVSKDYGILNENGYANRTTFVIDKDGVIRNVEEGKTAIDPNGAYQACSLLEHKSK